MSGSLFHVSSLHKAFGSRTVLDLRDLRLEGGHCYVLTGPNGSGKSTLLRILAGLEPGRAGLCTFAGRSVQLQPYPRWLRQQVIYVHQHPYLFDTSVADNIAYGLRGRGLPRGETQALVEQAMAWAGVEHLADVPPHRLSGGEKQRVALARAKVLTPRLLLLDEPTANLDGEARLQVVGLVRDLAAHDNCVLIACHDHEIINQPQMQRLHLADGMLSPKPPHGGGRLRAVEG